MNHQLIKTIFLHCIFYFLLNPLLAQYSFLEFQKKNNTVFNAMMNKEDSLKKEFAIAKLAWPPKELYIRSFKYDGQLEVWVRNANNEPYKLFKCYKVCALSGTLGPKRIQGDYQVPEGFYYIKIFNPESSYHLSLGLNYPNISDKFLSDSILPGGDIYIHGSCSTVGCIPITDEKIEELYLLTAYAKNEGQDFIPVHIFPIKYNQPKSYAKLIEKTIDDNDYSLFTKKLKEVFDYFEVHKKLPIVAVNNKGEYIIM